ncbi:hypothetical protein AJ79_05121 [Helicocarpus griseus UAMH5409]|uniref:Uncharacterized protein n=1 Tax=Helicocarpus griseus UAMH5409 TaxID=1447875 RepID=A0A2B7XQ45_9EURO|nr:hypothetical protein AJ79_05121 [Helicocarpus griseus UAMH5409]
MHNQTRDPPDSNQLLALFHAVALNRLNQLQVLLINGADPNVRFNGITPVHLAVRLLHPTAALLLLEFGANPNSRNSREGYITPLHALLQDFMTIAAAIPEKTNEGTDFLGRRCHRGEQHPRELMQRRSVIIRLLLLYGVGPAACCVDGFTPLMMSMVSPVPDSESVFALLIQGGITLNDRTTRGETVLYIAARMKDVSWLRRILPIAGSPLINFRDNLLSTSLFLAVQDADVPEAVEVLLSNSADVGLRGMLNLSSLDIAALEGNERSLNVLLDHITNLPISERRRVLTGKDTWGRTPIHICLGSDDFELACNYVRRVLKLEKVFSFHSLMSRDYFEATPIDYACKRPKPTADKDLMLSSLKAYQSLQKVLNEPSHKDNARCYDAPEFSIPEKGLTPVEEEWENVLEEWGREDGLKSKRVLLAMNYLGTVTERRGRLKRAQDLYYRGWTLARSGLGDQSFFTQDFACKFLRVSRDRGVDECVIAKITKWHELHGRSTLKPGLLKLLHSHEDEGKIASKLNIDDIEDRTSRQCDR